MEAHKVLDFWFKEIEPKLWWTKDEAFDALIKDRFLSFHQQATSGELFSWRKTAQGSLAEIIVLDQFSRNIYRDTAQAFAYDNLALDLAELLIDRGLDQELSLTEKSFAYLPYMHSESLDVHEKAVELYSIAGLEDNLKFEWAHKKIIERFGRYPHRNKVLGRKSTPEEIEFLKTPGSSF